MKVKIDPRHIHHFKEEVIDPLQPHIVNFKDEVFVFAVFLSTVLPCFDALT